METGRVSTRSDHPNVSMTDVNADFFFSLEKQQQNS